MTGSVQEKFAAALEDLIQQVKEDRSVLAAILCGSLSHDRVWAKSDIDLALVTVDDKKTELSCVCLNADGVNVHAFLMPRAEFRRIAEGTIRNSFMHSLLTKGRLLYTHDETIASICAQLHEIGERDTQMQLLASAMNALGPMDKARKWFVTRGDLDYSALWILYAATPLARIEVLSARMLVDREVIPQAMKLNPDFFRKVYSEMLNAKKTRKSVQAALDAIDGYLAARAPQVFRLVLEHLQEVGEIRSSTEIDNHFKRNYDIDGVTSACEYLADRGLIVKASTPVQLTRRSNIMVQEMAFAFMGEAADEL